MAASMTPFEKSRVALYYYLLGAKYYRAARAMDYAGKLHCGTRKDGFTPEFAHQIWIANFVRTLPVPESQLDLALTAVFLHDVREDKDVSLAELNEVFGEDAADLVDRLSKKYRGVDVPHDVYFTRLGEKALAALVKGADRLHNVSSMTGVFTPDKQRRYIAETRERHLPMIKAARRRFPEMEPAFENIKQALLSRIDLIERLLEAGASVQSTEN